MRAPKACAHHRTALDLETRGLRTGFIQAVPAQPLYNDQVDSSTPPSWASFFTAGEYDAFSTALQDELERRGLTFTLKGGALIIDDQHYGLRNIAQMCHAHGQQDSYPAMIRHHLDTVLDVTDTMTELQHSLRDFESVKTQLKVRIYPARTLKQMPDGQLIVRPVTQPMASEPSPFDLVAVIVADGEDMIATVPREVANVWRAEDPSIDDAALFRLAMANIAEQDPPTLNAFTLGSAKMRCVVGDTFFAASHVLHLSRYVDPTEYGLLVAVPHRHAVLIHRIEDHHVVDAIDALLHVALGLYEEGPGSITDQLFWWRDGTIRHLPIIKVGGVPKLSPPDLFVSAVLAPLTSDFDDTP